MLVAESTRSRRLIGRLDKGTDLLTAIGEVCRAHNVKTAFLLGLGAVDQVSICEFDQRARVYKPERKFEGVFEILNLTGNVSTRDDRAFVHANVTVSRERDNGIEVLGGHLLSGRVFAFEFFLDVADDLILKRTMDAPTGLSLWSESIAVAGEKSGAPSFEAPARSVSSTSASDAPAPRTPVTPPLATSDWQEVARASSKSDEPPPTEEEIHARPGDIIEHAKFGRCIVERVEGDYEFVSARLRNQRLIRLSLDVLTLTPIGMEGELRIFRALPAA